VSFVVSGSNGCPCILTPGVPCQYDMAWGKGTLRGVVEAGVHGGSATPAVGPTRGWLLHEDLA
jgi:hypothetical protein